MELAHPYPHLESVASFAKTHNVSRRTAYNWILRSRVDAVQVGQTLFIRTDLTPAPRPYVPAARRP